jgi:hypothetical protein
LSAGRAIVWRRFDPPGHEAARLTLAPRPRLAGIAVFAWDGAPCRLEYAIECDDRWRTRAVAVHGWIGARPVRIEISADGEGRWLLDGVPAPAVRGALDVDLAFSPSTNTLPIRRLDLSIGAESEVNAACLRFPELTLEPLHQRYRRTGAATYRYQSAGGRFRRDLEVDAEGLVLRYPGLWEAEASGDA